jgi:signal transduction histidine kinase
MNDSFYILIVISVAGIGMIITGFILLQVRNQNKLLQKQKQLAAAEIVHQKTLLQAVITSQETERRRIGSDLHDEVGAVLSSLRMLIEKHNVGNIAGAEKDFNVQSKSMIDHVISNVRQIAHNLSPHISGDFGFYDAVHELCDTVNHSATIIVALGFAEKEIPANFNSNTAMAVYRVLSELINNTIRHAQAQHISIAINNNNGTMQVNYADDGIGFIYDPAVAAKGMGMQNIESRLNIIGASWAIPEGNSKGFALRLLIPSADANADTDVLVVA